MSGWRQFVVLRQRWFRFALRAASFGAFVWLLWAVQYAPHRHEPFGGAEFEAVVQAINADHPYYYVSYPATATSPAILRRMSDGVLDHGVAILMTAGVTARQWLIGTRVSVSSSAGRDVVMLLFVVTAAAMVAPGVPLPVAIAGLLAFYALTQWGPIVIGRAVHWGVAFAALVAAVYLGTVLRPWTGWRLVTLSLLAGLAALAQILRQEAAGVTYGVGTALLMSAGVAVLAGRRSSEEVRQQAGLRALVRRAIAGGLLLIAANAAAVPLERWCISRQLGTPYGETAAIEHGSGWPLYLGLGYVSNPFNIAWRDPIGQVHAVLITSSVPSGNAQLHATLIREFARIVLNRPWLLIDNVAAKAARIHALAMRQVDKLPDVAVWQLPAHTRFYEALPWLFALCTALIWWRGTPEAATICVVSVALAVAASAGALVVFPDYIGGVQGAIVVLALIVPAAVASCVFESAAAPGQMPTLLARRILTWSAALAVGAIVIGGAFVAIQWTRYRALEEETFARDPLEAIEAQQFRYAHVFNDLPVTQQGRLLARLTALNDPRISRVVDMRNGDLDLFRPEALVRTDTQLHLIAWMGDSFRAPVPPLYQGRTHAIFFICGECAPESTVNDFPFDSGWTFISDLEWRGRYRMFSVPLNAKLKAARLFQVAAEKVVALDSSIESTGLRPGLISRARVSF